MRFWLYFEAANAIDMGYKGNRRVKDNVHASGLKTWKNGVTIY